MTDRVCVRGCVVANEHGPACGAGEVVVCHGCAPRPAREGAMVCDRCYGRVRRMLEEAPDVVAHLRTLADPTKAQVFDRVTVSTSKPVAPAPVPVELIDASADIVRTLAEWASAVDQQQYDGRLEPGAASDVAHNLAREFADAVLAHLDNIANGALIKDLADALLFRHRGDPEWWSVADAIARWPLDDRARIAAAPCPQCGILQVRVLPPRRRGLPTVYDCTAGGDCDWSATSDDDDGLWGDVYAEVLPEAVAVRVLSVCSACVAGDHAHCADGCACRCGGLERVRWLTRAEAAERTGRDEQTIRRWEGRGLRSTMGRYREGEVLSMEKRMRGRVGGRPRQRPATE